MYLENKFETDNIIIYKSNKPAIPISQISNEEDLAFDWTLSRKDIEITLNHRGNENLCRFAIQICILRKYSRFLSDYSMIPASVLGYLCRQLDLNPMPSISGHARGNTESDYQQEILGYLGWCPFDDEIKEKLQEWIFQQVSTYLYVDNLIEKAENFFKNNRFVIPGPTIFEREVNSIYKKSEKIIFKTIAAQLPDDTKTKIDDALKAANASGKSDFFQFAAYPPQAKAKQIVKYIKKYEAIASIGLEKIRFSGVDSKLLWKLASAAKDYDVWQIRRFDDDKKYSIAASFLYETKKSILDYLADMHTQFMLTMERTSRNAWDAEHKKLRKRVKKGVSSLKNLASKFLSFKDSRESRIEKLFEQVDIAEIKNAIDDCEAFERLYNYGLIDKLKARYNNFRRYFTSFVNLNFQCEPGNEKFFGNLKILRELNAGTLKSIPKNVDISFMPKVWLKFIRTGTGEVDRKLWEICFALALRDNLKSGNIFLPESRKHISFWELCYDDDSWKSKKTSAYDELGLPLVAEDAASKLIVEYHETSGRTESGLSTNKIITIEGDSFKVKREEPISEPKETALLRQQIEAKSEKIRIERLLMEIDRLCRFSEALKPLGKNQLERYYQALMAAIVAHGTNLGIVAMGNSTNNITVDMLQRITKTCLHEDAIKAANSILIDYLRNIDTILFWGKGESSSSDGQRFGVQQSSLLAAFYPRYFGYYRQAVNIYTHTSDQFSVFSTQAISCAEREALYVIDGLNNADFKIKYHYTDTHGYTEQIFALCYLLGFSFMPRIANFKNQKLYKPKGNLHFNKLDAVFSGTIDLKLIIEQWDSLVRVAASLKNGIVSANVIARKLANSSNRLAKAFTDLGRLVKTIYILRYVDDPKLRQKIRIQLNRGEARHQLAKYVFFANRGEFRSGDYFQIMNKANCLSLLSNAILIYNTLQIREVIKSNELLGKPFSPEAISRVSPLYHNHIIVNGIYDFSGN